MKRRDHTTAGITFLMFCFVVAFVIYVTVREHRPPSRTTQQNVTADPLEEGAVNLDAASQVDQDETEFQPPMEEAYDPDAWTRHPSFASFKFSDFPVSVYEGPTKLPDFQGDQRDYAVFRTQLLDAAKRDINFAGHYVVSTFGCGTHCVSYNVIDKITGRVSSFAPAGAADEELTDHGWNFRKDSNLLFETFQQGDPTMCFYNVYRFENDEMINLSSEKSPLPADQSDC